MRILIMSWPWALLWSKLLIILPISLSVNVMFDNDLSVKSSKSVGSTLLFCTKEHWLAKRKLNNSAFSLKSIINLFSWKIGGIQETFLPLFANYCCFAVSFVMVKLFWSEQNLSNLYLNLSKSVFFTKHW